MYVCVPVPSIRHARSQAHRLHARRAQQNVSTTISDSRATATREYSEPASAISHGHQPPIGTYEPPDRIVATRRLSLIAYLFARREQ